jgi:hypothetical protein
MAAERYVVAALARPRVAWSQSVARWATAAAIPCDLVRCLSAEELRTHLRSGRAFSAVLVDGGLPSVDRDLVAEAGEQGCAVLVVADASHPWIELGASAVLDPTFERPELLDVLATHARLVRRGDRLPDASPVALVPVELEAPLVAVCGPGGTGASTVAMACAQGLAPTVPGGVVLADLCRHADQALLHDVGDVIPGVQELVEIHRHRRPGPAEVRACTFELPDRGYHLLLGLRRARYWSALRPRAVDAALTSLRHAYGLVVCDVEGDVETEQAGGSADVEERHLMALAAVRAAQAVLVVGGTGPAPLAAFVRLVGELREVGVEADRIIPVCNRAPRSPRARSELARAVGELTRAAGVALPSSPLFLPTRRVDEAVRDGAPVPAALATLVGQAVQAVLARGEATVGLAAPAEPQRIVPGSLGRWAHDDGSDEPDAIAGFG